MTEGLRIQKCRIGGATLKPGEGEGRNGTGRRRDLEEAVRESVAARVADRQSGTVGGGRGASVLVWQRTCHLKRVAAEVAWLK